MTRNTTIATVTRVVDITSTSPDGQWLLLHGHQVYLSCGHSYEGNPQFSWRVGSQELCSRDHCATCRRAGHVLCGSVPLPTDFDPDAPDMDRRMENRLRYAGRLQ